MGPVRVISNWSTLIEGFNTSALEFYKLVEEGVAKRQVPNVEFARKDIREGGILSAKREYLLVKRGKLTFAVCSAPFGTGQFFSWWLLEQLPRFALIIALAFFAVQPIEILIFMRIAGVLGGLMLYTLVVVGVIGAMSAGAFGDTAEWDATIMAVPYLGTVYEKLFRPETYYVADTTAMFKASIQQAVREAMDQVTSSQGRRLLPHEVEPTPVAPA